MEKQTAFFWNVEEAETDEDYRIMTLEEVGAYHLLLGHQWMNRDIPEDPLAVAMILGRNTSVEKAREFLRGRVGKKFLRSRTGRLRNERLHREWLEAKARSKKLADSGRSGAYLRWYNSQATGPPNSQAMSRPLADHRYRPFLERAFKSYQEKTSFKLGVVFDRSDGEAIRNLLKKDPEITIDQLVESWNNFLDTKDDFHRKQIGIHPIRYWATRSNAFRGKPPKNRESELEEIEKRMKKK